MGWPDGEQGFIDTYSTTSGLKFDPNGTVARLNAARFLLNLLDLLSFSPAPAANPLDLLL